MTSSTFGGHLLPTFKPHRPLCPVRKDRLIPASGLSASGDNFYLRCNIIRAINVPSKSNFVIELLETDLSTITMFQVKTDCIRSFRFRSKSTQLAPQPQTDRLRRGTKN